KKTDLLGTGEKVKTWVLLAAYDDATKVHDKTIKDLAADLGMDYTASAGWVNVYYDGEYRGLYELSEKNSVGSTGVDITDMEKAYEQVNENYGTAPVTAEARNRFGKRFVYTRGLVEPEDITGGYLLEINGNRYDEASGFITRKDKGVNVKSPEWAGLEAMTYISEFYQEFEDAVYAKDADGNYTGYNAQTGKYYYDYVDRDSLVKFFMLKDLTRNTDSFYSSTFFYKDKDADKLVCGPVWDQELIFGTGWTAPVSSNGYYRQYLEEALVKIPDFQEAVRAYYQSTFREQAETLLGEEGILARNTAAISDSVDMDHILWPFVRSGYPKGKNHLWDKATTYADVTDNMTDWVRNRLTYLDSRLGEGTDGAIDPDSGGNQGGQGEDPGNNGGNGGGNGGGGGGVKPDDPTPVPTVTPTEEEPLFEDVPGDAYFADPVKWAVKQGITNGITGTRFGPDLSCTRAQMTAFLWRAAGSPEPAAADNPFSDVEAGSYYEKAVLWAVEKGITNGTSETTFSPKAIVTRGQSVTFLYRMKKNPSQSAAQTALPEGELGLASPAGEDGTDGDGEGLAFTDVPQGAYYYDAVRWAAQAGVTTGKTDELFAPDDSCTRAQIVTFLYRAMAE
ncbi:MAG: S-layer homology domain-containing protein, partial [Firmicutes bacterium]|nr:S-layer homology domain-containing protein [Bacillota bacterium]